MTKDDIKRCIAEFAAAAKRVDRIGYDVIELHGAHGYLAHQFLSPLSNQRIDEYGGSLENRMPFPLGMFTAVRARPSPSTVSASQRSSVVADVTRDLPGVSPTARAKSECSDGWNARRAPR